MPAKELNPPGFSSVLHKLKYNYTTEAQDQIIELLKKNSSRPFQNGGITKKYHDELLYLLAYPANEEIGQLAYKELYRILKEITENKKLKDKLFNSGIAGTSLAGSFSYTLNLWLVKHFSDTATLFSVDGNKEELMQLLNVTLSAVEKEMLSEEKMTLMKWKNIFAGKNKKDHLCFLLQQTASLGKDLSEREAIFEIFKINTQVTLQKDLPVLTLDDSGKNPGYFHTKGLNRNIKLAEIYSQKEIIPVPLTKKEKKALINTARNTLLTFFKETDPFTFVSNYETELFDMGKGIHVALYYMITEKKLALESYVGYLLFKNRVPIAYGGGWLLNRQCRFGINILPAFRGGESANIIGQMMRLYSHHFNSTSFVVEPYQLGKGNAEGINSASFWFYYKLGFWPQQESLSTLAANEFNKLLSDPDHRTPAAILKKLSNAVMTWSSGKGKKDIYYDINKISERITAAICNNYQNNRNKARKEIKKKFKLNGVNIPFFILLLIDSCNEADNWKLAELAALGSVFKLKNRNEHAAVLKLQKQKKILNLLHRATYISPPGSQPGKLKLT